MKQFYISILFICFNVIIYGQTTPTGGSTESGITSGELSVSLSGAATYTIPISVPPGITGIAPQISLVYNSQGGNGTAGYGWNISGVSAISRIPSTKYHDGIIDPVDFDSYDRFALDGQRLLLKCGTSSAYGANGAVYETEIFSNIRITSYGVHPNGANFGPAYFVVEYPDGSKAYYGNSTDSRSLTDWAVTYWENAQGVRISYSYSLANNVMDISSIKYGALSAATPINEIKFNYDARSRYEQSYISGQNFIRTKKLLSINVKGNGTGFRNYELNHTATKSGYDQLYSIVEKTGNSSKSYNPTVFKYDTNSETITPKAITSNISIGEINANNSSVVSGDFDGDAKMDFVLYPTTGTNAKKEFWLFKNINSNSTITPVKTSSGLFEAIFPTTFLTSDSKMFNSQGITVAQMDTADYSAVNFKTYYNSGLGLGVENTKKAVFPNRDIQFCEFTYNQGQRKYFFNGDFNGDGLTDVIAIDKDIEEAYCEIDPYTGENRYIYHYNSPGEVYFVDLDRRKTANFVNYAGTLLDYFIFTDSRIETFDVNGDGKTDILHFKNGKVYVYTLNNNNQLELLWQYNDTDLKVNQSILPGDYNGDGKMDFIISKSIGNLAYDYVKYLSKGNEFEKLPQSYSFSNIGNSQDNQGIYNGALIPLDINADGKTDIVQFRSVYSKAQGSGTAIVNVFKNVNSSFTASAVPTYQTASTSSIKSYPIPVFLSPKTNNQYLSIGLISNNQLYTFDSKDDSSKEGLLKTITTGNGVKETITYSPLQQDQYEPFYTPTIFTETFPNIDIIAAPNFKIVTKIEKQSAAVYKRQIYNYSGAVSNADGLGLLGFRSAMKTNWHNDSTQLISTVSKNSISLRGANIENFSVLDFQSPTIALPATYISRSVLGYNSLQDALQCNKVFKLKNLTISNYDGLTETSSITTKNYDQYNNPLSIISKVNEGTDEIKKSTTTFDYQTVNNNPYYIGLLSSKNVKTEVSGSIMNSEELYGYTNTTYGLLNQIKKKGDGTNYITEKNDYDDFGNIIEKEITAHDITPRVTNYEYEASGRFLIKSTDVEGLSKTFDYNLSSGVLISETNQHNLTTSYTYDDWFKKTSTTDYLGKKNTYSYTRSVEKNIITAVGDDNSSTEETFDDLGQKIKVRVKNISGNFSSTDYIYDIDGRNIKVSEPYLGANASQYNESKFDEYGRLSKNILFTGKTIDIAYSGLTTTVSENSKTKTFIKNAAGNITSMTETPGGTVTYLYYANDNLKEINYDGIITKITQDVWGRKSLLEDPSAGTYGYKYNELGEITEESTPNGIIKYVLDDVGKTKEKTIIGPTTDSKTIYTYDTSKLLQQIQSKDNLTGYEVNETYTYDSSKRVSKSEEVTPYAVFTKDFEYDTFGRVSTEKSTSQAAGYISSVKIKNTYKNGIHWEILDDLDNVLWQTSTVNAKGQLLTGINGSTAVTKTYDDRGYSSEIKYDNAANTALNILTLKTEFDSQRFYLNKRSNNLFNRDETFSYDDLDRLIEYTNADGNQETQSYDARGRILQNNIGSYNYSNLKPYQNSSIDVTPNALNYYTARPVLDVTYNALKRPVTVEEAGIDKITFLYNDSNDRSAIFYGGLQNDKLLRQYRKFYSADGTMEVKQDIISGDVDFVTYIGGDGYSAPLVLKSNGSTQNYLSLLRDYQGSILAIVNQNGSILEQRIFDAWGNIVAVKDGAGVALSGLKILDRGYTGHEHLQSVKIIHMNGRLYDPSLHRFLQPDNFVQDPYNTQNYNRYGYCWNNPLSYTDASGEWIHIVVGAVIGGVVNWGVHGFKMDMNGLKAFGIGAGAGAIGAATGGAAFGIAGGVAAGGGGFVAGAFSGAVGSFFSSSFLTLGNFAAFGDPVMSAGDMAKGVLFGAVTGGVLNGTTAILNGKTFWTGTTPRVAVQPMTLQPAGISNSNYSEEITASKDIRSDIKIPAPDKSVTSPTTRNEMSTNINIDDGYVDLSNRDEFKKIIDQAKVVEYSDDLVKEAQELYPNKAFKIEFHHKDPKYLGGAVDGDLVPLDASYHQVITNEFRSIQPYGQGPVDAARRLEIMKQVYSKYPLPPGY